MVNFQRGFSAGERPRPLAKNAKKGGHPGVLLSEFNFHCRRWLGCWRSRGQECPRHTGCGVLPRKGAAGESRFLCACGASEWHCFLLWKT